jgi:predicted Rossmann-fold nucleotide-binding protein
MGLVNRSYERRGNMRVLVCGGRTYNDREYLYQILDSLHTHTPITQIINGGAKGADTLAHTWAFDKNIPSTSYPADWKTYGRAAGPIRNTQMIRLQPDQVIAFPGGRGTANMIKQAREHNIPVMEIT